MIDRDRDPFTGEQENERIICNVDFNGRIVILGQGNLVAMDFLAPQGQRSKHVFAPRSKVSSFISGIEIPCFFVPYRWR